MILRVYRGRVIPGHEDRLVRFVREQAIAEALAIPGLLSFQPAIREEPDGTALVIVSTWDAFGSLLATGRDLGSPLAMPRAGGLVTDGWAEHFEVVTGDARGIPVRGATLRILRGRLTPNAEAPYFDRLRAIGEPFLDRPDLLAFHVGRRTEGRYSEIVGVSLWAGEQPGRALPDDGPWLLFDREEAAGLYAEPPRVERFQALTMSEVAGEAPAILLADDERRYLHATPAAARLTGRSVARLLTMRVDDLAPAEVRPLVPAMWERFLADGALEGPFVLGRPDGTRVEVRFSARARSPWPGCHASMLAPVGIEPQPDIDRGLVEAGFLSRYAVPG